MKLKKNIENIYCWLDKHPREKDCTSLYAAFPNVNKSTLRANKSDHNKHRKEGKWPEKKHPKKTNKSIDTCKQSEPLKENENLKNGSETNDDLQTSNESINESKNTFIDLLFDQKEKLFRLLSEYETQGAISLVKEIEIVKPFKGVSFLLMEKTVNEFSEICKSLKVSQRKAVHIALNDFIKKYEV